MIFIRYLDRLIGRIVDIGQWLILPLIVLLFLQWPLRDIVRAYSREANDLGQWIFALYVAISVTAATRAGTHLAADLLTHHYSPRTQRWLMRTGLLFGVLPWALFILIASRNLVINSVVEFEAFPDTYNPGYFIIKLALWVMAALFLTQAMIGLFVRERQERF